MTEGLMCLFFTLWFICWAWHASIVERHLKQLEESLRWQR